MLDRIYNSVLGILYGTLALIMVYGVAYTIVPRIVAMMIAVFAAIIVLWVSYYFNWRKIELDRLL